jgi:hypothetical protein
MIVIVNSKNPKKGQSKEAFFRSNPYCFSCMTQRGAYSPSDIMVSESPGSRRMKALCLTCYQTGMVDRLMDHSTAPSHLTIRSVYRRIKELLRGTNHMTDAKAK